jgi:hypothetical protein
MHKRSQTSLLGLLCVVAAYGTAAAVYLNTVVLPPGWCLTALASPATIQTLPDGRVSIYVVNPRNEDVRVYFRARKRR